MRGDSDRLRLLHGTDTSLTEMRLLRAGPVALLLDGIDLRYLRIGEREIVRRVYVAVRDIDWNTVPGIVSDLAIEEKPDSFHVEFEVRHTQGEIDFSWQGVISGDAMGRIEYVFDGRAQAAFPYRRIGLCVHHPWRETAAAWFSARTPQGTIEGRFPDLIGPQLSDGASYQPLFPSFDRIEIEPPQGGRLLLELEGDLWETEDHRNWTDANFKTYSTPLSLGPPAPLAMGQRLRQRLTITPRAAAAARSAAGPLRLTIGSPLGTVVPTIGIACDHDGHLPDAHERDLLAALAPAHLRVELRLGGSDWPPRLAAAQQAASALGAALELSLHLSEDQLAALEEVAAALAAGPAPVRVLVINGDSRTGTTAETTRAPLVAAVRAALAPSLPAAQYGGGTEIYFTEINRSRPQTAQWDLLCFSLSPQIHAFTDTDLVENLDAQAETVRSARAIGGDTPIVVSPITLRRRKNFYAAGEPPPAPPGELPDAVDSRQSSLLGGAWTAASIKYLAESGASSLTYYELTGWRGLVERAGGSQLPSAFRSRAGEVFPLYHPLADAIEWQGAAVLGCESSERLAVVGLAVSAGDGRRHLLMANLSPREQEVVVVGLGGELRLRRLHEGSAAVAAADPAGFRASGEVVSAGAGALPLTLLPYELTRIDPA